MISADILISLILGLASTNLCPLLLLLNALDWINFLHADLGVLEAFATTISTWQFNFVSATIGWIVLLIVASYMPAPVGSKPNDQHKKKQHHLKRYRSVYIVL